MREQQSRRGLPGTRRKPGQRPTGPGRAGSVDCGAALLPEPAGSTESLRIRRAVRRPAGVSIPPARRARWRPGTARADEPTPRPGWHATRSSRFDPAVRQVTWSPTVSLSTAGGSHGRGRPARCAGQRRTASSPTAHAARSPPPCVPAPGTWPERHPRPSAGSPGRAGRHPEPWPHAAPPRPRTPPPRLHRGRRRTD